MGRPGAAAHALNGRAMGFLSAFSRRLYLRIWLAVVAGMAVLTLLVLAQVFREGAAMREEQKMTI